MPHTRIDIISSGIELSFYIEGCIKDKELRDILSEKSIIIREDSNLGSGGTPSTKLLTSFENFTVYDKILDKFVDSTVPLSEIQLRYKLKHGRDLDTPEQARKALSEGYYCFCPYTEEHQFIEHHRYMFYTPGIKTNSRIKGIDHLLGDRNGKVMKLENFLESRVL